MGLTRAERDRAAAIKRNRANVNARKAAALRVAKKYPGLFDKFLIEERARRGLNGS